MKHGASRRLLAVLVFIPTLALAQTEQEAPPEPSPEPMPTPSPARPRGYAQLGFVGLGGIPLDHFGDVVDAGWGVAWYATHHPRRQPLGLRLELSFLEYGSEKVKASVADAGGRIHTSSAGLHVTTSNDLVRFALGPQVAARRGGLRPFAYATVGGSWFSTISKLNYDDSPGDGIASTTNCSDWTLSWSTGAGVLVRVHRAGFLELGAHYLANLPVDWLAEGDLGRDRIDPARPQPRHSAVNLVEIVVGFTLAPP